MKFNYKNMMALALGEKLEFEGHQVFFKARTQAGEFILCELGNEDEDSYLLLSSQNEELCVNFHPHMELPMGTRSDLAYCPWLFAEGDVESDDFADKIVNQADKKDYVYKKLNDFQYRFRL